MSRLERLSALKYFTSSSYLPLIALLLIVIFVNSPIHSSLWLDETISIWTSQGSFQEVVKKALEYQGQSPLYFVLLGKLHSLTGFSPETLRYISLLMFFGSCYLFYSMVLKGFNEAVAGTALLILLCFDEMLVAAISLRPYSPALLFLLLSIYALFSWMAEDSLKWKFTYFISTTLMIYFHYIFAAALLLHWVIVFAFWASETRISIGSYFKVFALVLFALVPAVYQMVFLLDRSDEITIATVPGVSEILLSIAPAYLLAYVGTSIAFALVMFVPNVKWESDFEPRWWVVVLFWWLAVPVLFALLSVFGGVSLFLQRYFVWCYVGAAFTSALFLHSFKPKHVTGVVMLIFCLMLFYRESNRQWEIEDWKNVARILNENKRFDGATVFLYTGLIEADIPSWLINSSKQEFLKAPFQSYPISQKIVLLPSRFRGERLEEYWDRTVIPELNQAKSIVTLSSVKAWIDSSGQERFVHEDLSSRLKRAGISGRHSSIYSSKTLVMGQWASKAVVLEQVDQQ